MSKEIKTGASNAGKSGQKYVEQDNQRFEQLNADLDNATKYKSFKTKAQKKPPLKDLHYTEKDTQQFKQLSQGDEFGSHVLDSSVTQTADAPDNTDYLDSDNRHFEELMSADIFSKQILENSNITNQSVKDTSTPYSPKDLEQFEQLLSSKDSHSNTAAGDSKDSLQSTQSTEAKFIKIVDFDKKHASEKALNQRGNTNIKILYFD